MEMKNSGGQGGCYVKVNDPTFNYEESGEGKPLFVLHGGDVTSEIWIPHCPNLPNLFKYLP